MRCPAQKFTISERPNRHQVEPVGSQALQQAWGPSLLLFFGLRFYVSLDNLVRQTLRFMAVIRFSTLE
jgi:hypothetical protein